MTEATKELKRLYGQNWLKWWHKWNRGSKIEHMAISATTATLLTRCYEEWDAERQNLRQLYKEWSTDLK